MVLTIVENDFGCCVTRLKNGSVAYTLNNTFPSTWTTMWNVNDEVIVDEDGKVNLSYVDCKMENGYILKDMFSNVVCHVESPHSGVSMQIQCTDSCKLPPSIDPESGEVNSQMLITLVIFGLLLIALVGFLVYKSWRWCCVRGGGGGVENRLDQNPSQEQHPNDQNQFLMQEVQVHQNGT